MALLLPDPSFLCLTFVCMFLALSRNRGFERFGVLLSVSASYSLAYVFLSAVGQSSRQMEETWLSVILAVGLGAGAGFALFKGLERGSLASRTFIVAGMVGLGLLTALFSGPQGGAGKFVYFLEHVLHLSEATANVVNFVVRKGLHLSIYGTLAVCAGVFAWRKSGELNRVWVAGLAWGVAHSVLDEMTQSKTSTRTGTPWDVILDVVGMVIGLSLVTVAVRKSSPPAKEGK